MGAAAGGAAPPGATERSGYFPAFDDTYSATAFIWSADSVSLNAGIAPPPLATWASTFAADGLTVSRLGPTRPLAPAAASAWQLAQPAESKTSFPDDADSVLFDPQPASRAADRAMTVNWKRKADGLYRRRVCVYPVALMRSPRALLLLLGFAALLVAALQGLTGVTELVFYAAPFLLVVGLLLSGRFIGEEAILARRVPAAPRPRPVARRWPTERERPLTSLLERSTRLLRGPPALSRAA